MSDATLRRRSVPAGIAVVVTSVALLAVAGCATTPWHKLTEEEARIADQCTDISDVIRKNYSLGSNLNALLVGLGIDYRRYGTVLSSDAAERTVELDRVCRAYAMNKISSDEWVQLQQLYAEDSAKAAQLNPKAAAELRANLDELRQRLEAIAKAKGDPPPALASTQELLDKVATADGAEIRKQLAEFRAGVSDALTVDSSRLHQELLETNKRLDGLEGLLAAALKPAPAPVVAIPPKKPQEIWSTLPTIAVPFAYNESGLSDQAKSTLRAGMAALKSAHDFRVDLSGYADSSGSAISNSRLSLARAEEVRDFLVSDLLLEPSKVFSSGHDRAPARFGPGAKSRVVEVRAQVFGPSPEVAASSALLSQTQR